MSSIPRKMIFVSGVSNLLFAVFHMMFWRFLNWQVELAKISAENSSVMQVLNLALIFVLLAAAYVAFFHGSELIQTRLGRTLLVVWSLFWFFRAVNQVIFWGVNVESLVLTMIFILVAAINLMPAVKAKTFKFKNDG